MFYYRIAEIVLRSQIRLPCFENFLCEEQRHDVDLSITDRVAPAGKEFISGELIQRRLADEWFFSLRENDGDGMFVSDDYTHLQLRCADGPAAIGMTQQLTQVSLECLLARRGYVALHAATVELDGEAYAFTGPSGMGKSTRASAWMDAFDARLVSGDRPLIKVDTLEALGVPWDGKECCFRSVRYPLKVICEVRRSAAPYARAMSFPQRRRLLLRQCFLPMWDTETAAIQMMNISRLASHAEIIRVFCGPDPCDAQAVRQIISEQKYFEEAPDMKAKNGFVLRHILDEYVLMPVGDNIAAFKGSVLLNEVSAFVWEKLQSPVSREDLISAIISEYEVDEATATADLDDLLAKLNEYGIIEND